MSTANAPSETKRISTGSSGLDALLQGGFLPNRSYLIGGEPGTGKTIACIQFLLAGLKNAEKSVYVTVDERPAEILQSAASLGWDLQKNVQDKSLVILDASPYFTGRTPGVGEKGLDLGKFVSDLADYSNRLGATRLAIDPITPLILPGISSSHSQENARTLIHLLQTQLTTTNLLTSHSSTRANRLSDGVEEFLAAGVIALAIDTGSGRLARTLRVKKMRATAIEPGDYPFAIIKGKGIDLLTAQKKPIVVDEITGHGLEFFELSKSDPL